MSVRIEEELLEKYDVATPRYTSYPTAPHFHHGYNESQYREHAKESNEALVPRDLSIYVHIPFCHSLCYFCGCNKIITQSNNTKVDLYIESLLAEVQTKSALFDSDRKVTQIHFGGGTPNFLKNERLAEIIEKISSHFHFSVPNKLEIGIEVDPRIIATQDIELLSQIGFNRFSIGVQDFSEPVQRAVNRIQSEEKTLEIIQAACQISDSVNVDLITGLPQQSISTFRQTLEKVINSGVTRIASYNFAYLPERIKAQRLIDPHLLPSVELRLELVQMTRKILSQAGFEHIGMDHFAKRNDSLAIAYQDGTLQRNFQGYTTHKNTDLLGLGVGAISHFRNAYAKNSDSLSDYQSLVEANQLPIMSGYSLNDDDILRAQLIQQVMCQNHIDLTQKTNLYVNLNVPCCFMDYFKADLQRLIPLAYDNLVTLAQDSFDITEKGHFFRRNIASTFDSFLGSNSAKIKENVNVIKFSKAI
jgi:oxygen-independent coproporphyrinogen-3 oxidase